jgi:hypothetical protein
LSEEVQLYSAQSTAPWTEKQDLPRTEEEGRDLVTNSRSTIAEPKSLGSYRVNARRTGREVGGSGTVPWLICG